MLELSPKRYKRSLLGSKDAARLLGLWDAVWERKLGGWGAGTGGLDRRGKSGRCGEGKPPARALAVCGAVRGDELDVNNSRQHL